MKQYQDFFIILNGAEGAYTVEARGPSEITIAPRPLDFTWTDELRNELELVKQGFSPSRERMKGLGGELFNAIFPRQVARAFSRAYEELPAETNLRLKLIIRPPELNTLPWELLFDPDDEFFLAARLSYPVVRFVESSVPVASLKGERPLRVLYIQSQPRNLPTLNLQASEQALRKGFEKVAEVTTITACTPEKLRDQLRLPYHVLHYDGHAFFDAEQSLGAICLEDEEGNEHHVAGDLLASYLDGSTIRLVVLAACESGMDSPTRRFAGIAQQLMKSSSLPAVVAMQFAVADTSAIAFTQGFYKALADDYPVEAALVEARKTILDTIAGDPFAAPDWATPVLFMRSKDGNVLPPPDAATIGQRAGAGLQALSELALVSPQVRQAAGTFRATFEAALAQVDVMGDYKDLHDLLHQLQFHCYEGIVTEEQRFKDRDETTLDMFDSYHRNLRDIQTKLQEVADRKRVSDADITWFQDVDQAQTFLRGAVDNLDDDMLKKAISRLRRIIGLQPVRINKGLIDAARALRLPSLVQALQEMNNQLQTLQLDEQKTASFIQGMQALEGLATSLDSLLNEHDHWQTVDGEVRRVDSLIEQNLDELEMSWEDIKTRTIPLFIGNETDWAKNIQAAITKLDEALPAGNPANIRRAFKGFRREANSRFFQVDTDLKILCGSLRQIGEPLNAILRSFA